MVEQGTWRETDLLTNWQEISVSHPVRFSPAYLLALPQLLQLLWFGDLQVPVAQKENAAFIAEWITPGTPACPAQLLSLIFLSENLSSKTVVTMKKESRGLLSLCWVVLMNDTISWIICPLWAFVELKICFLQLYLEVDRLNGQILG